MLDQSAKHPDWTTLRIQVSLACCHGNISPTPVISCLLSASQLTMVGGARQYEFTYLLN